MFAPKDITLFEYLAERVLLEVGDRLAGYEILAHLKNGGMATLYLARHESDPGIVALKVVHQHLSDDAQAVRMFVHEAALTARIKHPNVVRVDRMVEAQGAYFIVMEYVHGCSLAQLLQGLIRRRRRMSPELAVYIAMLVADGLHAAHELRGDDGSALRLVHRDVSPQNILLAHTGEIKLIDFGIAKARSGIHHSSTGLSIKGKLRYMSPEHAKGQSVDRRTDVYALAVVLWEMLTMRPLFWADTDFAVLAKVQNPHVKPPSTFAPRITPALDDAIMAALNPKRDLRPPSAREFRQMLATAVPFAEALDHEQVAELLDVVLGDELDRAVRQLPEQATANLGQETTQSQVGGEEVFSEVLDALTVAHEGGDDDEDSQIIDGLFIPSGLRPGSASPSGRPPSLAPPTGVRMPRPGRAERASGPPGGLDAVGTRTEPEGPELAELSPQQAFEDDDEPTSEVDDGPTELMDRGDLADLRDSFVRQPQDAPIIDPSLMGRAADSSAPDMRRSGGPPADFRMPPPPPVPTSLPAHSLPAARPTRSKGAPQRTPQEAEREKLLLAGAIAVALIALSVIVSLLV